MLWGLAIAAVPLILAVFGGKDILGINSVFALLFGSILALVGLIVALTSKPR